MKYWRGYLVAFIMAAFTSALVKFAAGHQMLVDMIWPYLTRTYQTFMADWSSEVSFCVWQVILVLLVVLGLAGVLLMIILRWNPIQLGGWVLAVVFIISFFSTCLYDLNDYSGSIAKDIHLQETEYTTAELEQAAVYFRDQANALADDLKRAGDGHLIAGDFDDLAQKAGQGYEYLVYEKSCSVFAGSTAPVKKLGWAEDYTEDGITGKTVALTGESAVNPETPAVAMPFIMCHEMAHRMSITRDRDADLAAFLACIHNSDALFQYSAYFMAYRYCYYSLENVGATAAAGRVSAGEGKQLQADMKAYSKFFADEPKMDPTRSPVQAEDSLLKIGKEDAVVSYGRATDLLVSWHIQEIILPTQQTEEKSFDPYDPSQVDLTGLVNAPQAAQ